MFAGLDAPPLVEHTLVPKAKIIDFGLSQVLNHTEEATLDRMSVRDLEDFDQKMGFTAEDWGDVMAAPPDTDTDLEETMSSLSLSSDPSGPSGDKSKPGGDGGDQSAPNQGSGQGGDGGGQSVPNQGSDQSGNGGGPVGQGADVTMALDFSDSSDSSGGPPE
jgi:hypothetical protein